MSTPSPSLVGIGAATLDLITLVDAFPSGESTAPARAIITMGGGPVATALCTAARAGIATALIDSQGDDWAGRAIIGELEGFGVDISHILTTTDTRSAIATITVRRSDGARAIRFLPSSAPEPTIDARCSHLISNAQILHLNGRHPNASAAAVAIAQRSGTRISFDGGAGRYAPELSPLLAQTDILIVAKSFAEEYLGGTATGPVLAQDLARQSGAGIAGVTAGADGSWVHSDGTTTFVPAEAVPTIVDTTGCGDVYHGEFLAALLNHCPPLESAIRATRAAAANAGALGGRGGLVGYPARQLSPR